MRTGEGGLMEQILVSCLLALFCPLSTYSFFLATYGRLEPEDPLVEEGNTLILNCTLSDYTGDYNASDIYFRAAGHRFNDTYVRVLSPVTAQLVLPNVTVSDYGNKLFICGVPDSKNLAHQSLTVARRPLTPKISGCVVYNWERMVCTWTPTLQQQKLHHKLYRKIDSTRARLYWNTIFNTSTWYECPNSNEDNCTWHIRDGSNSLRLDTIYYVQVEVENLLGTIYSEIREFNSSAIVKPAGLTELSVRQVNDTSVVVSWMPPAPDKHLLVHYQFTTDSGLYDKQWQELVTTTEFPANFTLDVTPYTSYSLTAKTRPKDGGYWSDNSTVHFRSQPSVPGANPQVTRSSFEIGEKCGGDCREITLHWTKIDRFVEYGPALQYEIKYKCSHSQLLWQHLQVAGDLSQYTIEACTNEDVVVYIAARNSEGLCHLNSMKIVVPQHNNVLQPVDDFVVTSLNGTVVNTRWQPADETDVASRPLWYTLYWCKGVVSSSQCRGQLDWMILPSNRSEYNISLPGGSQFHDFLFGVAVSSEEFSSGISWADCLYSISGIASPPKHVRFSPHRQHASLIVEWDMPSCHNRHGYIIGYAIYYCIVDTDNSCIGMEDNVTVSGSLQTHVLTELEMGQTYRVRMDSLTAAGTSHSSSKAIYQQTTRAGTGLSPRAIAAIVVSVVIGDVFLIIGVVTLFMRCCKLRHWYSSGLSIKLPASSERRRSLQMSTASDAPLTGYDRWGYKKQISFSIRSADSGTGSLSTDENATTPTYSENEISFYPHGNATGAQASPLMSGKPSTIGEEVEECDEVFLHNGVCPPGDTVKKGGDTYVRVDANGDTSATKGDTVNGKPNFYADYDRTLLEQSKNYSKPSGNQSYYNGGSENCYAFIGGFTTHIEDGDTDSCSGVGDSVASEHCTDRDDSSLNRDHLGGSVQSGNKITAANPPQGGYVSVDATGAVISPNSDTIENPATNEQLVTDIDIATAGGRNDHRHGNDDAKARQDDWFVNNADEGEHIPLVEEISDDTDSSSLHSSNADGPQITVGYVSVDSNGQPVTMPEQVHKSSVPTSSGYVTVDGSGHVNAPVVFTPGQWRDGITNPGCVDYAKSSDSDSSTDNTASFPHTQTLPNAESCSQDTSERMQNLQQHCDTLVPNSNGYVAINTEMMTC